MSDRNQTLLTKWARATSEINPENAILPQQRLPDSGDKHLGVLAPEMQKFWCFLEGLRVRIEDITQQLEDMKAAYSVDYEKFGDNIPKETLEAFQQQFKDLEKEMHEPAFASTINRSVFKEMLDEQFPLDKGQSILGIRKDFVVVSREKDSRGDGRDPLEKWNELTKEGDCPHCRIASMLVALSVLEKVVKMSSEEKGGIDKDPATESPATPTEKPEAASATA